MDGILIVDKPKGATSHDIVDFIRKKFNIKKVGHSGTLDPQATGVLILLIGKFTKRSREFTNYDKEYQACLTLGIATNSLDGEGQIIKKEKVPSYTLQQAEDSLRHFLGEIRQIPPMFSALKYKGKKLYTLARQGLEVQRPPRQVYIYELKVTKFISPHIYFVVKCSKGTYIRTLCADISGKLGCVGYMSELCRIKSGPFTISQAISLDMLKLFSPQKLREVLIEKIPR